MKSNKIYIFLVFVAATGVKFASKFGSPVKIEVGMTIVPKEAHRSYWKRLALFRVRSASIVAALPLLVGGIAYADPQAKPTPPPTSAVQISPAPLDGPNFMALAPRGPVKGGYPKWSQFPVAPTNVPSAAEFARRVQLDEQKQAELNAGVSAIIWDPDEPVSLGDQIRARIDQKALQPIEKPLESNEIEAFAASLRAKVAPPPVIN